MAYINNNTGQKRLLKCYEVLHKEAAYNRKLLRPFYKITIEIIKDNDMLITALKGLLVW